MCILQIQAHGAGRFFEVLPGEKEHAELMVEDMVSRLLLMLFGGGTMDEVAINFSSGSCGGLLFCSIRILAHCSCQHDGCVPCSGEQMQRVVEKSIGPLLRELFGLVNVDLVMLSPSASAFESDPALSW